MTQNKKSDMETSLRKKFNILSNLIKPHYPEQRGQASIRVLNADKRIEIIITYGPIQGSWFDAAKLCEALSEVRVANKHPLVTGDLDDISDLPDKAYAELCVQTPVSVGDNAQYGVDHNGHCYLRIVTELDYNTVIEAVDNAIDVFADPTFLKADQFRNRSNWFYTLS
jgi:hypothetical protein